MKEDLEFYSQDCIMIIVSCEKLIYSLRMKISWRYSVSWVLPTFPSQPDPSHSLLLFFLQPGWPWSGSPHWLERGRPTGLLQPGGNLYHIPSLPAPVLLVVSLSIIISIFTDSSSSDGTLESRECVEYRGF